MYYHYQLQTKDNKYIAHLSFNSILPLINGIFSDLQKLLKYFNGTALAAFFRIPSAFFGVSWAIVFPNNLALYLKDLKLPVFSILLLASVAPSLE